MQTKPVQSHYTETEVAEKLGISIEDLRALIRMHILPQEEELRPAPAVTFQPSDLLLLRLLSNQPAALAPRG